MPPLHAAHGWTINIIDERLAGCLVKCARVSLSLVKTLRGFFFWLGMSQSFEHIRWLATDNS